MEQRPKETLTFEIRFHRDCQRDLENIHPNQTSTILDAIRQRLPTAPQFAGTPIRGSKNFLYKFRVGKCRVVYTILYPIKQVWVLAVEPRSIIYREENLEALLRIAIAIHSHR